MLSTREIQRPLEAGAAFAVRTPTWLVLLLCGGILAARKPDAFYNPQFWAEDAWFYQWAVTQGLSSIFEPYAGYLHVVPRLVALVAAWLDPLWAPAVFVSGALAGTLYVAARTRSTRSAFRVSPAFAFATVLIPDAYEVLLNLTNLQWLLVGGLVLVLLSAEAGTWPGRVHDVGAAALLGLTGPFSTILFPLFIARAWQRRTAMSWVLAGIVTGCGLIQLWWILHAPDTAPRGPFRPDLLLAVTGLRVAGSLLGGGFVAPDVASAVAIFMGLATIGGIAFLAGAQRDARKERIILGVLLALLLMSTLYRHWDVLPDMRQPGYGARYFYAIQLCVVWLLVESAFSVPKRAARVSAFLALWALAINLHRLREPVFEDLHWRDYATKLRAGEAVEVMVNPRPWTVPFPAKRPPTP